MVKIGGHTRERGYSWKLCPYSTAYASLYYDNGFAGPTHNPDITEFNFGGVVTAEHVYTSGTLNIWNPGGNPGWLCMDDDCPYLISTGRRYFEL